MRLGLDFQSFIGWVDVVVFSLVSIPELSNEEKVAEDPVNVAFIQRAFYDGRVRLQRIFAERGTTLETQIVSSAAVPIISDRERPDELYKKILSLTATASDAGSDN